MKKILIIDDEEKLRGLLTRIITLEGFEVSQAVDCRSALQVLKRSAIQVVICDVKLPDGNGVDFVKKIKRQNPLAEIIMLTAYGSISDGVQAMKNGAFDYITKGDDNNKIIPLIHRAIEKRELADRVNQLERQLESKYYSFDTIIGKSDNFLEVVHLAKQVALTDSIVLLTGETGTGKEVFAQSIHQASLRKKRHLWQLTVLLLEKIYWRVNCSDIEKGLSLVRCKIRGGCWRKLIRVRSFWMKLVKWISVFKLNYYV